MGAGALIASAVLGAAATAYSANEQRKAQQAASDAQRRAMEQQQQAQEKALAQQREQAARAELQTEIANNKANAQVASAASQVTGTSKNQNSANLTGGTGIATSDLALGGAAQLGAANQGLGANALTSLLGEDTI